VPKARVVVVGGGPAGNQAASRAASLGAEVTLVERGVVGGAAPPVGLHPLEGQ
jgi:pyruvate/2-oxoglutarate dehydrogenase complex dihydrolipoamide dehydrogenase (E3) component